MRRIFPRRLYGALLLGLHAAGAAAGVVTVDVRAARGGEGSALDSVVVFDPLDAKPPPGRNAFDIDQVKKTFQPHVSVIRTGTVVSFPNSDNIHHEVYSFSAPHPFTREMFGGEPHVTEVFDKPGVLVLGCNIHDSMVAFVLVVDSPYFAKTPASGRVELTLPPGRYRLRVWNVDLESASGSQLLTVGAEPLALTVDLNRPRGSPESWPD